MNRYELKILIIEDDLVLAENLKKNLIEFGYSQIAIATDSKKAISLYKRQKPDLCIVDINLKNSEIDGIDTINSLNAGHEIPVIYLTAFDDQQTRVRAKKTNPAAYLIKPVKRNQIDVSIDIALHSYYRDGNRTFNKQHSIISDHGFTFVRVNERYEKLHFRDILYLMAKGAYCQVFTCDKKYFISANMGKLLEKFRNTNFLRCHRSFVVNVLNIHSFDHDFIYLTNGQQALEIPIGAHYKADVATKLIKI